MTRAGSLPKFKFKLKPGCNATVAGLPVPATQHTLSVELPTVTNKFHGRPPGSIFDHQLKLKFLLYLGLLFVFSRNQSQ